MLTAVFALFIIIGLSHVVKGHCDLLIDDRRECGYMGISKVECEDRNCCWIPFSQKDLRNPPWCVLPISNPCGYTFTSPNTLQDQCNSSRLVNLTVQNIDQDILRVKIERSKGEFHVPEWIYPEIDQSRLQNTSELNFKAFFDQNNNFNFEINRNNSEKNVIWNTELKEDSLSSSSFQMKFMYTQVGSQLPVNHSIYGLGYHAGILKVEPGTRLALFARDSPTVENQNLYGAHPFFIEIRNGTAHGVVNITEHNKTGMN